jgi:hypothetical protein
VLGIAAGAVSERRALPRFHRCSRTPGTAGTR